MPAAFEGSEGEYHGSSRVLTAECAESAEKKARRDACGSGTYIPVRKEPHNFLAAGMTNGV